MFTLTDIILFGIGGVILALWLVLYLKGRKNVSLFDALEEKEYPLKEVYFVGYEALNIIKYAYRSKRDRKLRKEISILYGEKYAEYYLRVIHAQQITIALTLFVLAFVMYGLANDIMAFVVVVFFAFVAYYYFGTVTSERILKRSEEMMSDFSEVISKLALLTNAGMIFREAWEEVAFTGERALYLEMQAAVGEMQNGYAEVDALFRFGVKCVVPEIKKFTSTVIQGITKGNSELSMMLQEQSREIWNLRRQNIRRQGEKAANKLMIPIMIMFVGILIMVLIPIFSNMGA
ncbi:MAG: type II secretion system F family protein [Lachnospiraceae bacterium]|nr:type II secretion system F family protein [Lachnospiraceae bacterium]